MPFSSLLVHGRYSDEEQFDSHVYNVAELASVTAEPGSGGAVTIVLKGRNFYDISVAYLNGIPLATKFVNIGELRATLPANQRPAAGPYNVTVRNSWPGGGASMPKPLALDQNAAKTN